MNLSTNAILATARTVTGRALPAGVEQEHPAVTEALGYAMAQRVKDIGVDTVVFWSDPHTAVLAHVVARELDANLIYAYADHGILSLSSQPPAGAHAMLVDFEWDPNPGLLPLVTMLRSSSTVTAIASVLPVPTSIPREETTAIAVFSLADTDKPTGVPSQ